MTYGSPLGKAPFSVKTWSFIGAPLAGCGSVVQREKKEGGLFSKVEEDKVGRTLHGCLSLDGKGLQSFCLFLPIK